MSGATCNCVGMKEDVSRSATVRCMVTSHMGSPFHSDIMFFFFILSPSYIAGGVLRGQVLPHSFPRHISVLQLGGLLSLTLASALRTFFLIIFLF